MNRAIYAILLACLSQPLAAQSVHRVDGSGAGDFLDLASAVTAAAPGDTVIVAAGDYLGTTVNKPLQIVADGPGVELNSPLRIENIAFPDRVLISGIESSLPTTIDSGVEVENCTGTVWIDSFRVTAFFEPPFTITNCDRVVLVECLANASMEPGMVITDSTVHIQSTPIAGGISQSGLDGNPGMIADGSTIDLQGLNITGGPGRGLLGLVGDGGPGAVLLNGTTVFARELGLHGGFGGTDIFSGMFGNMGPSETIDSTSSLIATSGPLHRLDVTPIARVGDAVDYDVTGPAGHLVALNLTIAPDPFYLPIGEGSILTGAPQVSVFLGALDASGQLLAPTIAPPLGSPAGGLMTLQLYAQIVALDPLIPAAYTGEGRPITLLAPGF